MYVRQAIELRVLLLLLFFIDGFKGTRRGFSEACKLVATHVQNERNVFCKVRELFNKLCNMNDNFRLLAPVNGTV